MPTSLIRDLVIGGAGFLGSHLCNRLMESGEEVICLDKYFTGRKASTAQWMDHSRFELIRHDVTEPIGEGCSAVSLIASIGLLALFGVESSTA